MSYNSLIHDKETYKEDIWKSLKGGEYDFFKGKIGPPNKKKCLPSSYQGVYANSKNRGSNILNDWNNIIKVDNNIKGLNIMSSDHNKNGKGSIDKRINNIMDKHGTEINKCDIFKSNKHDQGWGYHTQIAVPKMLSKGVKTEDVRSNFIGYERPGETIKDYVWKGPKTSQNYIDNVRAGRNTYLESIDNYDWKSNQPTDMNQLGMNSSHKYLFNDDLDKQNLKKQKEKEKYQKQRDQLIKSGKIQPKKKKLSECPWEATYNPELQEFSFDDIVNYQPYNDRLKINNGYYKTGSFF